MTGRTVEAGAIYRHHKTSGLYKALGVVKVKNNVKEGMVQN
jgi:hypothetical protein